MLILTFASNVQLFAEPELLKAAGVSTISPTWSPNQLAYTFAFGLGNFGAAAVMSLIMLVIGLVAAASILIGTNLYRTDPS